MKNKEVLKVIKAVFHGIGKKEEGDCTWCTIKSGLSAEDDEVFSQTMRMLYNEGFIDDENSVNLFFTQKGEEAWNKVKDNDELNVWAEAFYDIFST